LFKNVDLYRNDTEALKVLGPAGAKVIKSVASLIREIATECDWPLDAVDIRPEPDPEVEGSEYVMVVLRLHTSLEEADAMLDKLYPRLQAFLDNLSGAAREAFVNKVYFDVAV
jgi:hypothetical protein